MTSTETIDKVLNEVDQGLQHSLDRLFDLLRIKSISTDLAYVAECQKAADWITNELTDLGFDAAARPTPGNPVVVAHGPKQNGPHVLFYAHYDVQPVDPIELWDTDPFNPQIIEKDGRKIIVARGASDDKGQMLTFIEACRAWKKATGSLPLQISLMLEGEEESGGKNLPPFMAANAEELKADIALVCDTDMWDRQTPSITTMLRGLVGEEITITAADKDLHSGMFGNAATNPNQVVANIIAGLRAPDGSCTLPGFYDDVAEISDELKAQWAGLGFDEKAFLGGVGLATPAGEKNRTVLEQIWARPTCEINGMSGGYTGEGFKTVIPSKASAKISFRLVSGMDPVKVRQSFHDYVEAMLPPDCTVSYDPHGGSPAITVPAESEYVTKALQGLTNEWDKQAVITGSGGSIPVVGEFKKILDLDTLLIGFAHIDDQIHSPNEKYDLDSYHKGIRSWVRVLGELAKN
jgi:acetylornithine deacetylase/succinyl-diaminopimelate desuccinylase-like protein